MNSRQTLDWLKAASDCRPALACGPISDWVRALPEQDWRFEVGLSVPALWASIELRVFAPSAPAAESLRRQLGLLELAPAPGWPAAGVSWSGGTGEREGAWGYGLAARGQAVCAPAAGPRLALRAASWKAALRADPALAAALGETVAACPIRDMITEWPLAADGRSPAQVMPWSLRLDPALPWPSFARLSLAQPFAEQSSLLAYLLLDRRVSQVRFRGERMTVYLGA